MAVYWMSWTNSYFDCCFILKKQQQLIRTKQAFKYLRDLQNAPENEQKANAAPTVIVTDTHTCIDAALFY